jgi:hypothetical protein
VDRVIGCAVNMGDFIFGGGNERVDMRRVVRNEECGSVFFQIGWGDGQEVLVVELNFEDFFEEFLELGNGIN